MMKTNETDCRLTFLRVLIYFYRILGITFGGISLDEKGNLVKSPFWLYYGWFGCITYISLTAFIVASMHHQIFEQLNKDQNGTFLYYMILVIWPIIGFTSVISIVYVNQKFGFKIFDIFIKCSLTKFKKLKLWKNILCAFSMVLVIIFVVQSSVYGDIQHILSSFFNNIVLKPLFTSLISVSWMVSIGFSENIKIVRKYLSKNMSSIELTQAKKLVLINYKNIKKIDQYLAFNYIMTATGTVLGVMSAIYIWIFANKAKFLTNFLESNISMEILQFIILILTCFFLEKCSKETQKLFNHLDNININVNDDQLFKALILFRISIDKAECRFTIGGFAPWNKLTLLQVTLFFY